MHACAQPRVQVAHGRHAGNLSHQTCGQSDATDATDARAGSAQSSSSSNGAASSGGREVDAQEERKKALARIAMHKAKQQQQQHQQGIIQSVKDKGSSVKHKCSNTSVLTQVF
jgi:hypothetical protein